MTKILKIEKEINNCSECDYFSDNTNVEPICIKTGNYLYGAYESVDNNCPLTDK